MFIEAIVIGTECEVSDGVLSIPGRRKFLIDEDSIGRLKCACGKNSSILFGNKTHCIPSCSECADKYRKNGVK